MNTPEPRHSLKSTHAGAFNYLDETTQPSLFRNGRVLTRRDKDGSDGGSEGVNVKSYTVDVHNARLLAGTKKKTCELNGFELLHSPLAEDTLDFFDHNQVVTNYYRECEKLVAQSTGGRAFAFDHNLRSALGKKSKQRISGGQTVQGPAKIVHGDYTLVSAPARLQDLARPPGVNDTLASVLPPDDSLLAQAMVDQALADDGRFAIINVWRNIAPEPVQTNPLAMCDGKTVESDDLVTFEIHYSDRIGENYFSKHSAAQRFYFYPEMTREEPLLLKQWDSAGALAKTNGEAADTSEPNGPCTFSFHSAFDDLDGADNAPDRLSIEVRCIVIY